jgi:hypothetical protein
VELNLPVVFPIYRLYPQPMSQGPSFLLVSGGLGHGRSHCQTRTAVVGSVSERTPEPVVTRKMRRKLPEAQAVKVKLLPVPHSTSFSGISFAARSTKFCPLQCIGIT